MDENKQFIWHPMVTNTVTYSKAASMDTEQVREALKMLAEAVQKRLEDSIGHREFPPPEPQYLVAHIDDIPEIARLYRKNGLFLRRVKGRALFSVYESGPNGIHRLMSKYWSEPPRATMMIAVDTTRQIERGKMVVLPKLDTRVAFLAYPLRV